MGGSDCQGQALANGDVVEQMIIIDEQPWLDDRQLKYVAVRSWISRSYKALRIIVVKAVRKTPNEWIYPYYIKK
ncbi:hypothetical protein KPL39_05885 [Clostridium gasigenes]|uniref:hypothetical protein n=1 Tax=Clostridium gasigenes TaxID=94869 RepID=UPI001C0B594D|nr:hypothetical protein [Clostridium gasigenes]MBU3135793.1 hypothetical protein [Clostridium gasigenes]